MFKCLWCGRELKYRGGRLPRFCRENNHQCYYKWYYANHREEKKKYCAERHKRIYTPHPILPKYATREEAYQAKLERQREWYYTHKEMARERNSKWYREHRDDPDVRERHRLAMRKYWNKRKEEKINERIK